MLLLVIALGVISLVGAAVLIFAAGPSRGREVPGMSPLAERVRSTLSDDPSPAYGLLSTPEGARRAEERFERAEEAVQEAVVKVARPVSVGVSASGERLARGVRAGGRALSRVAPRAEHVRPALGRVGPMLETARQTVRQTARRAVALRVSSPSTPAQASVRTTDRNDAQPTRRPDRTPQSPQSPNATAPAPERAKTQRELPAPAPVGPGTPRRGSQPRARHRR